MFVDTAIRKYAAVPLLILASLLILTGIAQAHDLWLAAGRFVLMRGDTLVVHQFAGTELEPEYDLPLNRSLTRSFRLTTDNGSIDLLSLLPDPKTEPEVKPVLRRVLDFEGLALLTMEHAFIWEEFTNDQFRENLEHEEFDPDRFEPHMGQRGTQTERYARSLKLLIQVGDVADGDLYRRSTGQQLEILLLQNPYMLDPGDDLEVQVLFEGQPLSGRLVRAYGRQPDGGVSKLGAVTNENGFATFRLDHEGFWLIRLTHLLPCAEHREIDCEEVNWESYWTSYSFELT